MTRRLTLCFRLTLAAAILLPCSTVIQAQTPQLTAVLARMDATSKSFKSATANFEWDYYQKIVHDTTSDKGSIFFQREGASTDIGAVLNGPNGKPKQVICYAGGTLQLYTPSETQLQVFQAGGGQSQYQGFLTLGVGGSGTDLKNKWNITDLGPETLTIDGEKITTEKLNLEPKDPAMAKSFKNVVMWVDTAQGIGVKQVFYTATGGNYRTTIYSHIHLNGKVDRSRFGIGGDNRIKTERGTQVFNH